MPPPATHGRASKRCSPTARRFAQPYRRTASSAGCEVIDLDVALDYVARAPRSWQRARNSTSSSCVSRTRQQQAAVGADTSQRRRDRAPRRGREADLLVHRHPHRPRAMRRSARQSPSPGANESCRVRRSIRRDQPERLRRHAHISHEPRSREFRLHDDGSEHGTGIVRGGRTVPVPRGARGIRLQSGDEIVLGDARLRVRFDADPRPARPHR